MKVSAAAASDRQNSEVQRSKCPFIMIVQLWEQAAAFFVLCGWSRAEGRRSGRGDAAESLGDVRWFLKRWIFSLVGKTRSDSTWILWMTHSCFPTGIENKKAGIKALTSRGNNWSCLSSGQKEIRSLLVGETQQEKHNVIVGASHRAGRTPERVFSLVTWMQSGEEQGGKGDAWSSFQSSGFYQLHVKMEETAAETDSSSL